MAEELYSGRRLSYDGSLCTVRFHGKLNGNKGEWLGVEWDDPSRGKHNGQHQGQQVFTCQHTSNTAGSFIRPSRKRDEERTVLEAIQYKYSSNNSTGASEPQDLVVISGKVAEEVGFEKIAKEQARLADLRIVLLDQLIVNGITHRDATGSTVLQAQQELSETCPNIVELDIGWNTIERWQDVADICSALPKLRVLRAGGLRFSTFDIETSLNPLSRLRELHLEDCLLGPNAISGILNNIGESPDLEQLDLSGNELQIFPTSTSLLVPYLTNLRSLTLDNNRFKDLNCVPSITKIFPGLRSLSLQANHIRGAGDIFRNSPDPFKQIQTLNIANNSIQSYNFLDILPTSFPKLSSLQVTGNPFFNQKDSQDDTRASEKSYYLTLARIPVLKELNYTKITAKDRQEGELYYISIAEAEVQSQFTASKKAEQSCQDAHRLHPLYETLVEKYGRQSIIETLTSSLTSPNDTRPMSGSFTSLYSIFPLGSIGARLVKATFYIPESTTQLENKRSIHQNSIKATIELPSSIPVKQVMGIVLRHPSFQRYLQPLRFDLIFESKELDPVDTTAESSTRSAIYSKSFTQEQRRSLWKDWGNWDADVVLERASKSSTNGESSDISMTEETWTKDGICIKDGRQWKRREVNIPHSLKRAWGDWLESTKEVLIRIVPHND